MCFPRRGRSPAPPAAAHKPDTIRARTFKRTPSQNGGRISVRELRHNPAMKDPRALLADFRSRVVIAPALAAREDWLARVDALAKALEAQAAQIGRLRQDIEDAEHTRDAANLARMRVFGQLNTL